MTNSQTLRMAIDIGGTFTDTVLMEGETVLATIKTLTTHDKPGRSALDGAQQVLAQAGRALDEVEGFIHGTTLATNALIEKRGAKLATITTEGFRDILEIAYERRYAQYDINLQKPDLLASREHAFTIPERMLADGSVLQKLDLNALDRLIAQIDNSAAEAVAICLLHSYANNSHEQQLAKALGHARPDLRISVSSDVSPEAREFDRLCTTLANAYIQPLMERYLSDFQRMFAESGLKCPILMMTAGGGMTTLETAKRLPIRLVESGPAGGAVLAARIAAQTGENAVLSFDMGGTTAKLCLIDKARPQTSRAFEIARAARFVKGSGMPVRIPVIDMIEIGAGGGSIAAVDRLGRLNVGPQSAGSEPGPVAFGRGGAQATVTDADVMLGYIRGETFAQGAFAIDDVAAAQVLAKDIGGSLNVSAVQAADGISGIVDESMASAGRMHAVESGKDLGVRTMIAFGGNGPLHATRVARSAGVSRILVPPNPGVGSAVGFLFAPVRFEIVRSRYAVMSQMDVDAVNTLLNDMTKEAMSVVKLGSTAPIEIRSAAFMRYKGQGHEIEIPILNNRLSAGTLIDLKTQFEVEYQKQFSRPVPGMEIEILNWMVQAEAENVQPASDVRLGQPRKIAATGNCEIFCDVKSEHRSAGIITREELVVGDHFSGPVLVTEAQTTTLVSADFDAQIDGFSNLVLTRKKTA